MGPLVTVLIPAYNAEKTLEAALDSVLSQTYHNLEVLLINDGSTDETGEIGLQYSRMDSRIIYIEGEENKKLVKVLNQGLLLAKGKYIARMDADDLCRPDRIRKQVDYMEAHPDVAICGTWMKTFGSGISHIMGNPETAHEIKKSLMYYQVKANLRKLKNSLEWLKPFRIKHVGYRSWITLRIKWIS